ncbi:putative transcription factor & chromatin remodeling ARID family [Lupinus albus]|uniref:Putative transcription factor & chromatin remodeling ARID family n=1 Tax=Lupinus albus TaxID=3870 RepID=A0A6A4PPW2_LUPAL|nr:putative transcription factor & chromatin remodeling ARID family [Lupinus albus]
MSPVERNVCHSDEEERHYPPLLASHEDLVRDPNVFWDTLRRFHFLMGTKFLVPVIGGKELDMHVLYVEVTRRSGYEKVVSEKKWREVGSVFNFSSTITSASYVLRKHYFALLYHYEQVHFFKLQGPLFTPLAPASVTNHSWKPDLAIVQYSPKPINKHHNSHAKGKLKNYCAVECTILQLC